jgi:hypothetical protein
MGISRTIVHRSLVRLVSLGYLSDDYIDDCLEPCGRKEHIYWLNDVRANFFGPKMEDLPPEYQRHDFLLSIYKQVGKRFGPEFSKELEEFGKKLGNQKWTWPKTGFLSDQAQYFSPQRTIVHKCDLLSNQCIFHLLFLHNIPVLLRPEPRTRNKANREK